VFGVALGVSTTSFFLFVLFGALLERAGPETISSRSRSRCSAVPRRTRETALSVRHDRHDLRSSVANVVTTGTFTIPLISASAIRR